MSSAVAMNKHSGGVKNYHASEGKCGGAVMDDCLMTLLGGIRSTCTYVGAKSLKELLKGNSAPADVNAKGNGDVIQEKEALMSYLPDQAKNSNQNENEAVNVAFKLPFDMMTTQMKDEWVKKREAESIRQTANDLK